MLAQFLFRARAGQFSWGAAAGGAPPPRRWLPPSRAQGRVHAASPLTLVLMLLDLAPEGPGQVGTPGPVLQLWWLMGRRWGPWGERDGPSCVAVLRLHRELAGRLSTPQARSMEWAVTHTDQFREDQGDRAGRPPPPPLRPGSRVQLWRHCALKFALPGVECEERTSDRPRLRVHAVPARVPPLPPTVWPLLQRGAGAQRHGLTRERVA